MKKTLVIVALLAANLSVAFAQFEKGTVEMSLAGTAGYQKVSASGNPGYGAPSKSIGYINIYTTCGYYLLNGLSIEPQIGALFIENNRPSESALLSLSYTKLITNTSVALYFRLGYGLSNGLSLPIIGSALFQRVTNDWDIQIFNVGGGLKILVAENIALRIELNYRSETFNDQDAIYSYYPADIDYTYSNTALLFGFSVLL
jgi:opacity protein-like surface antigen